MRVADDSARSKKSGTSASRSSTGVITILITFAAGIGLLAGLLHRDEITAGDLVPGFTLHTADGPIDLGTLTGRAHLLIFARPDCPRCGAVLPVLDAALRRIPFALLPRWVVWDGSRASLRNDRWKLGLTLPCGTTETSWRRLGVRRVPVILLVGSDSRVERVWRGGDSLPDAISYLNRLVGRREFVRNFGPEADTVP